jgi:hypothetical protein
MMAQEHTYSLAVEISGNWSAEKSTSYQSYFSRNN